MRVVDVCFICVTYLFFLTNKSNNKALQYL